MNTELNTESKPEFKLLFARLTDEQAIVAVKRIQMALFQPPLQPVLQERCAPVVEVHAALLVDQRLQELQLGVGEGGCFARVHVDWLKTKVLYHGIALAMPLVPGIQDAPLFPGRGSSCVRPCRRPRCCRFSYRLLCPLVR